MERLRDLPVSIVHGGHDDGFGRRRLLELIEEYVPARGMKPRFFAKPEDLRAWLERHHDTATELWIGLYKKSSGKPSVTWPEVGGRGAVLRLDRRRPQEHRRLSYMNRFTPRKPTSNWSAVNVKRFGS